MLKLNYLAFAGRLEQESDVLENYNFQILFLSNQSHSIAQGQ